MNNSTISYNGQEFLKLLTDQEMNQVSSIMASHMKDDVLPYLNTGNVVEYSHFMEITKRSGVIRFLRINCDYRMGPNAIITKIKDVRGFRTRTDMNFYMLLKEIEIPSDLLKATICN